MYNTNSSKSETVATLFMLGFTTTALSDRLCLVTSGLIIYSQVNKDTMRVQIRDKRDTAPGGSILWKEVKTSHEQGLRYILNRINEEDQTNETRI